MNNLKIIYPNLLETQSYYNKAECANHFKGNIKNSPALEPECTYYTHTKQANPIYINTDEVGKINKVTEYGGRRGSELTRATIQELKDIEGVQIKTTTVTPFEPQKAYQSIQRLDKENGLYSVVRKKGDEIIGGYEANLSQRDRKFATGFKGKLEKLALRISTNANGCERKGLRNIGDLLFKISKRIR